MTVEEFKSYPDCGGYTDEQANQILISLEKLAVVLFDYTCQQNGIVIDNQLIVSSNEEIDKQNLAA